jgi:hypothetical protein
MTPQDALGPPALATLDAALDRLIPSDALGPGAREARVARYLLRRLAGPLRNLLPVYAAGLARLEADARALGCAFVSLDGERQDELLRAAESRSEDPFFELLLAHATEGMFGDPAHGGNADRAGWMLIGYPGPRPVWTEADQQLGPA